MSPRIAVSLLHLQTDGRLARLVAAGDPHAFETLVARHRLALTRHCRRILPAERAADAVQQALINAHRALVRGDRVDDVGAWLHRIAHNAALEILRERAWADAPLETATERAAESADAVVERRERLTAMIDALGTLPDRQREALVLQALEGCSHEQIALRLGTSDGAVRQLLARGRSALRAGCAVVLPFGLVLRRSTGTAQAAVGGAGVGATVAKGVAIAGLAAGLAGGATIAVAPHAAHHRPPAVEARAAAPTRAAVRAAPAAATSRDAATTPARAATKPPRKPGRTAHHAASRRAAAAPAAMQPGTAPTPAPAAPHASSPATPIAAAPQQSAGPGKAATPQHAAPPTAPPAPAPAPGATAVSAAPQATPPASAADSTAGEDAASTPETDQPDGGGDAPDTPDAKP